MVESNEREDEIKCIEISGVSFNSDNTEISIAVTMQNPNIGADLVIPLSIYFSYTEYGAFLNDVFAVGSSEIKNNHSRIIHINCSDLNPTVCPFPSDFYMTLTCGKGTREGCIKIVHLIAGKIEEENGGDNNNNEDENKIDDKLLNCFFDKLNLFKIENCDLKIRDPKLACFESKKKSLPYLFILYFGLYINDIMGEKGGAHYEEILEQIEKLCRTCSDCAEWRNIID